MPLSTDLFDYVLPPHLVAQAPADRRDASRLFVVNRKTRATEHIRFADLPHYVGTGDVLVRNNAAVLPARLRAHRPTGGAVECFLLRPQAAHDSVWWCLIRPGKKLPVGATFGQPGAFEAVVLDRKEDGAALVRFSTPSKDPIEVVANRLGEVPLPPYIERHGTAEERELDVTRYQTVYADRSRQVAVAAPTAGLHFTPQLLETLAAGGVTFADVTLHVGLGTFRPITTSSVEEHAIHHETYELSASTQRALFDRSRRRIAVGTTTVRSVEDFLRRHDAPLEMPFVGEASVFIYPPATFKGVDAMITNFHQPRSTLLCLVSAFLTPGSTDGIAWLKDLYQEAIRREYRFFSYGDAMLIL